MFCGSPEGNTKTHRLTKIATAFAASPIKIGVAGPSTLGLLERQIQLIERELGGPRRFGKGIAIHRPQIKDADLTTPMLKAKAAGADVVRTDACQLQGTSPRQGLSVVVDEST